MYKLLVFVGLLLPLISAVPATAVVAAPSTTTTCNPAITFNAKFDNLKSGSPPASGFGGANWNGFTVVNSTNYLNPKSDGKYLQAASAETSSISINGGNGVIMQLKSFFFGCVTQYPLTIPAGCTLQVTSLSYTAVYDITVAGPYTYTVDYGQDGNPGFAGWNMTKADVELQGSEFYFQLIGGASSSILYLDNVITVNQNMACEPSD